VRVAEWAVDGDSRVATVQMRNTSAGACLVDNMPEPWLVQSPQLPMLVGGDAPGMLIRIGPGDTLRTTVRVRNYCGPAPKAPVTIAFRRSTTVTLAQPLNGADLSGVPPCGGYDPSPADVQMQPWGF
jgi:hypothetical protein